MIALVWISVVSVSILVMVRVSGVVIAMCGLMVSVVVSVMVSVMFVMTMPFSMIMPMIMPVIMSVIMPLIVSVIREAESGSKHMQLISGVGLASTSLPAFFVGYVLLYFFAVKLQWVTSVSTVFDGMPLSERLAAVMQMVYLVFNEGYSADRKDEARAGLADEAIRLGRLLLRMFQAEPEVMGLLALMLLQHSRSEARFDANGETVLLEDQDRSLWRDKLINEGLALIDKAMRHRKTGVYLVQAAIAALHARARRFEDTDWAGIDALYATLERLQPSPVVTLNRAVAVSKTKGPQAALEMIEPLGERLSGYFHYHGARGGLLLMLDRRREARESFDRAIALANTAAEAAHIRMHIDRLIAESEKRA